MPLGLNASILLAKAVGLSTRARTLAQHVTGSSQAESAAIELETSNIRMLLTDTLRGASGGPPVLEDCRARLEEHATHLADLEERRAKGMQRRR